MGSVAALALALVAGFNAALLAAAGLYVAALVIVLRVSKVRSAVP
jgi:hypothetical protein